jgi:hypothetical protein
MLYATHCDECSQVIGLGCSTNHVGIGVIRKTTMNNMVAYIGVTKYISPLVAILTMKLKGSITSDQ